MSTQISGAQTKIAYIILAHKLPELLVRLVERLDSPRALFLIHVDRKTRPEVFGRMRRPLAGRENVTFLPRHVHHWAGWGHVRASLKGIFHLVRNRVDFGYAALLTGQDYPIKPRHEIESFLAAGGTREFLYLSPMPRSDWGEGGGMERIETWNFHFQGKMRRFPGKERFDSRLLTWAWAHVNRTWQPRREFLTGFEPYGGHCYWCLTRECIEYVHDFVVSNPHFVRFFRWTWAPDHFFYSTIVGNSRFKVHATLDNLRYVDWDRDRARASGRHPPAVLETGDLPRLAGSNALFGSKFDLEIDAEVLDAIDRELLDLGGADA